VLCSVVGTYSASQPYVLDNLIITALDTSDAERAFSTALLITVSMVAFLTEVTCVLWLP
jgi:hypothetical protein